jgi:transcriptional regulator with XRE-family HTH domain
MASIASNDALILSHRANPLRWDFRERHGLSQERLAHDAEVDRSYVGGLERQEENPTVDLLDRLAKTLEVQVSEFFKLPRKGAAPPKPLRSGRQSHRSRLGHR